MNGVYNLAFGDNDITTGKINDKAISNNKDTEKILATVVAALYGFTDKYQDSMIYATGSTASRTRLYRMGITKYIDIVKRDFQIFGQIDEDWEVFELNVKYDGFLVKRKKY